MEKPPQTRDVKFCRPRKGAKNKLIETWDFLVSDVRREVYVYLIHGDDGGYGFKAVAEETNRSVLATHREKTRLNKRYPTMTPSVTGPPKLTKWKPFKVDANSLKELREKVMDELENTVNLDWKKKIVVFLKHEDGAKRGFSGWSPTEPRPVEETAEERFEESGRLETRIDFSFQVVDISERTTTRGEKRTLVRDKQGHVNIIEQFHDLHVGAGDEEIEHAVIIDWSPEKEEALKILHGKFIALIAGLRDVLSEKKVEKTLELVRTGGLNLLTR
jgi:hypothetical protein